MTDLLTHWKLVVAKDFVEINGSVRKLMDEGWRPIGNHQVTVVRREHDGTMSMNYSQAMAKYEKRKSNGQ